MTSFVYQCSTCGRTYRREAVRYLCPECGKWYRPGLPLAGVLLAWFDYAAIKQRWNKSAPDWSLFCPVEQEFLPPYPHGNTPFFRSEELGRSVGLEQVWLKNDGLNPSGSLKDRASFLVVAEANRLGEKTIVTASTGNAASALAAVCAPAGKQAIIFVPEKAPRAKLVQMLLLGARVILVKGTYDDAFRLSLEYTAKRGGLNRNTAYHPLTLEGKKTVALEIFAQNGFRVPDAVVVPVGDGVILGGVYKGFYDLREAGLTAKLPRLICVQAETSAAIHHYLQTEKYADAPAPATVADSISVSVPSNAHYARKAVLESNGFSLTVSDAQILAGQRLLAERTGMFAEPAAAATVAALQKLKGTGRLGSKEQVVLLLTGHGLKDVEAAMRNVQMPAAVEPKVEKIQ